MSKSNFPDNKLFSLLASLSSVEKRELHHFLASPFFNRRAEVEALWRYLCAYLPDEAGVLTKESIFAHLFPGSGFDDGRLRYTFTFLQEKIEWFLAFRQSDRQPAIGGLALAASYRQRNLEKHFRHTAQRIDNEVDKMPFGLEKRWNAYRLELEKYSFAENQNRTRESNLQSMHDAFDVVALSGKLRLACLMAAHQAVVKVEYDPSFLSLIVNWLDGHALLAEPEVGLYYHCYRALSENSERHFQAFRQLLETHGPRFDSNEVRDILLLAINFCIRQVNAGQRQFIRQAFDLYRLGITNDLLKERGVLSRFTYKNIVALGLGIQEFGWVEKFIHDYRESLEERHRESSFSFNLAKLFFTQKKYKEAMPLLAQVGDADFLLMLDARVLLLKMYYELGELDALDSLLASMRSFIRRRQELGYHQSHYLGIVRFTQKLLALRPGHTAGATTLRQEIEAAEGLPEKEWLLEKIGGG